LARTQPKDRADPAIERLRRIKIPVRERTKFARRFNADFAVSIVRENLASVFQKTCFGRASRLDEEGASRSSRHVGGMRWTLWRCAAIFHPDERR
jgi:hypothetical protein